MALGPPETEPLGVRGRIVGALRRRLALALRPQLAHQRDVDAALADAIAQLRDRVRAAEAQAVERDHRARELAERTVELGRVISDLDRALRAQVRAALHTRPYLAATPFGPLDSPAGPAIGFALSDAFAPGSADDETERAFAGRTEQPRDRCALYLALLDGLRPMVGLGATELVDRLGGEVVADDSSVDLLAELDRRADGSLGAVFCVQLLERLPMAARWRLLELVLHKLRPGGVFIAETANPHSASAMRLLAHAEQERHPLYPEVALAMCGLTGFAPAFVFAPGHPAFEPARFIARDFAIVATRPSETLTPDDPGWQLLRSAP